MGRGCNHSVLSFVRCGVQLAGGVQLDGGAAPHGGACPRVLADDPFPLPQHIRSQGILAQFLGRGGGFPAGHIGHGGKIFCLLCFGIAGLDA